MRVIPEHLMVFSEASRRENGAISRGFYTFAPNEFEGPTVITYGCEHATRAENTTEEQALTPRREIARKVVPMWLYSVVPTLKQFVQARTGAK